jgi:hypothetical protein
MELGSGIVRVILSEEGQAALARSAMISGGSAEVFLPALEADEKGLWIDIRKEDGQHLLLIRWDCILAIDVPIGGTPLLESFVQA